MNEIGSSHDLEKITYEKIHFAFPNKLFRGTSQKAFEITILESFKKYKKPYYWGWKSNEDEGLLLTFFSESVISALRIAETRTREYRPSDDIFTFHPLVMEIDLSKRKYHVYKSKKGEGYIIKGLINTSDLNIIYSAHKDDINKYLREYNLTEYFEIKPYPKNDIIDNYQKNKDILSKICMILYGYVYRDYTERQKKIVMKYLDFLKKKTR